MEKFEILIQGINFKIFESLNIVYKYKKRIFV